MKKIVLIIFTMACAHSGLTQINEHLENFNLSPESFDNGASLSGDFVFSTGLTLSNYYDTAWASWSGFAMSNITDNTTPGWGNQYSAFPGSGADSSENYSVFYPSGVMSVNTSLLISSFDITNTTYAAISMRDGDSWGKQFGSPTNANGVIDGTNGEDYLRVWIICEDHSLNQKDSIEFYLADYRFADSLQDYIIDDWQTVDLSTIPFGVGRVSFRFESSDMTAGWINTPTYLAVDNINMTPPVSVDEMSELNVSVYPNPFNAELVVKGEGSSVVMQNSLGEIVYSSSFSGVHHISTEEFASGMYTVLIESERGVIAKKLVK